MTKAPVTTTSEAGQGALYHARFELDPSGQWLVELQEVPEVHTFGRTLGKAREYLIDALALWLNEPASNVRSKVEFLPPTLPPRVDEAVKAALAERAIADVVTRVAGDSLTEASKALVEEAHLSLRDAADILGISHQRVQQIVASPPNSTPVVTSKSAVEDFARTLREYLPGGTKEDLGALATVAAVGLAMAWIESRL